MPGRFLACSCGKYSDLRCLDRDTVLPENMWNPRRFRQNEKQKDRISPPAEGSDSHRSQYGTSPDEPIQASLAGCFSSFRLSAEDSEPGNANEPCQICPGGALPDPPRRSKRPSASLREAFLARMRHLAEDKQPDWFSEQQKTCTFQNIFRPCISKRVPVRTEEFRETVADSLRPS